MLKFGVNKILQGLMVVVISAAASTTAWAGDLSIKAFSGHWQGSGISESEVSVTFRMTARDLDVTIKPSGSGFALTTTTVQRKKGDPNNPDAVRKSTELDFQPGVNPGVYVGGSNRDPLDGKPVVWSRVKEQTLITHSLAVAKNGASNHLIYRRTLSASGMNLNFQRFVDGKLMRTVKGRLIKTAN